jgi:hypothetical protein
MKEKLYDLPIDNPLSSTRRKAINQHIARNAHLSDSPVHFDWDKTAGEVLHITAQPVAFEVRFHAKKVEIYGSGPLWTRLLLTAKRKELLKQEIQSILLDAGFVSGRETKS